MMVWPFRTLPEPADEPACGDIFEATSSPTHAEAVNKYLQNLELSAREQIKFLTEMLEAVVEENNELKEQLLQKQNELDQERQKKLQTP